MIDLSKIDCNYWQDPTFTINSIYERAINEDIDICIEEISLPVCVDWDRFVEAIYQTKHIESARKRQARKLNRAEIRNLYDIRACKICGHKYAVCIGLESVSKYCSKKCRAIGSIKHRYEIDGKIMTIAEMSQASGFSWDTIIRRLQNGKTPKEAIAKTKQYKKTAINFRGSHASQTEIAATIGIKRHKVEYWVKKGLDGDQIETKFCKGKPVQEVA